MEQIYTVRVKCRPDPSLSFPSERTYSSSTVGGLAVAHFFLAALTFTLCSLGYASSIWRGEYAGALVLVCGAVGAGLTGVLACKRWYIDRHIRWFLAASILSCICALSCGLLTSIVLLAPSFQSTTAQEFMPNVNFTFIEDSGDYNSTEEEQTPLPPVPEIEFRREIYIHILLASIVEFIWSLLSIRIAWKGTKKSGGSHPSPQENHCQPQGRPDILENLRKESSGLGDPKFTSYSDVVKELCRLQRTGPPEPGLPLPESHLEYRQRMEKFLAGNTAVS